MHKLILDNLLLINHSNMFRPLSRSHHQWVRNPWQLQSHCIDLLECCYVYVFTSRYDSCGMLNIPQLSYHIRFWSGNQNKRDHLKQLGANGRIILKWTLTDYVESACSAFTRLRIKIAICCDYSNENSGSIEFGEFLNYFNFSAKTLTFGVSCLVS